MRTRSRFLGVRVNQLRLQDDSRVPVALHRNHNLFKSARKLDATIHVRVVVGRSTSSAMEDNTYSIYLMALAMNGVEMA
jgi:hypothetical protein